MLSRLIVLWLEQVNFFLFFSRGLIHNFCKILELKIKYYTDIFDQFLYLISAVVIQAWHLKVKAGILYYQILFILKYKISKPYVEDVSDLCE
jgi:hypothetical protein